MSKEGEGSGGREGGGGSRKYGQRQGGRGGPDVAGYGQWRGLPAITV